MQSRYVVVSLSGPWGPSKASTYTKCRIEIPANYPTEEPPSASLDRTAVLDEEVAFEITDDLHTIAAAYQKRHRHSLEAMLRYLLGEQTCEESLTLLKARPDSSAIEIDQQAESSSSDEDDDNEGKLINNQGRGLGSSDGLLAVSNAQYNVPLPKNCGAFWAGNGRLICFFPPKEPKVSSLIGPLNLKAGERRAHRNIFENFGRLHGGSPVAKKTPSIPSTIESGDSDFDDSSLSSNSSSFSGGTGLPRLNLMPSIVWRAGTRDQQHTVSIDESSGPNGQAKSALQASRNYISIHDFADLLPAKYHLAKEYILGKDEKCCLHNAKVARQHGHDELADVWSLVDLILRNEVPLDRVHISHIGEPVSLIARRIVSPLNAKDSAIDLSYDSMEEDYHATVKGQIKWGGHPFGEHWLIDALFEYFEQQADVQMLAMLAHILGSRSSNSEQYFPSLEVAKSQLQPPTSKPGFKLDSRKVLSGPRSMSSSVGASTSDPLTPFSTGITPPSSFKPSHVGSEHNDHLSSMSSSPERFKQAHRSSSNLASAFAAHLSRPFNFSASASSSPPTTYPKRRLSPATSHLGAPPSNFNFSATSFFGKSNAAIEDRKPAYPPSVSDGEDGTSQKSQIFRTILKNQDQFDNDGYSGISFLDSDQQERYSAYRSNYANILTLWQLPIVACEMLEYSDNSDAKSSPQNPLEHNSGTGLISMGKDNTSINNANAADLCVSIEDRCLQCGDILASQPKSRKCTSCLTELKPITCLFCASIIRGLSSPCLNCGHVLHASCRSAWHYSSDDPFTDECLSGCGCRCLDHLKVELSLPPTEVPHQSTPLVSALRLSTIDGPERTELWEGAEESELADDDAWEDVAYESLARNLGGRFLTPKTSQIWRGGEGGEERRRSLSAVARPRRSGSS